MKDLQLTFRHMEATDAIKNYVEDKAEKLYLFYDRILGCHVILEVPHQHTHQGKKLQVKLILNLPGEEFAIKREAELHHNQEDSYVAIRDAFNAAKRKIQDYIRRKRFQVKNHVVNHPIIALAND